MLAAQRDNKHVQGGKAGKTLIPSPRLQCQKVDRDAESLALLEGTFDRGTLLIGFEHRHRIQRFPIRQCRYAQAQIVTHRHGQRRNHLRHIANPCAIFRCIELTHVPAVHQDPAGDMGRRAAKAGEPVTACPYPEGNWLGERWRAMHDVLATLSRTGLLFIQNGADHHARQDRAAEAIGALAVAAAPTRIVRTTLRQFATELMTRSAPLTLPVVRGELRDSYGYTWTLQGTLGTRAHQKRANATLERTLVRDVEPWMALGARGGDATERALLRATWRALLVSATQRKAAGITQADADARLLAAIRQFVESRDY